MYEQNCGFSITLYSILFCDLQYRERHQITICHTYVHLVAIKWDKKAHSLTKTLKILVKHHSLVRRQHVENFSSWTIDRHCGIFVLYLPLPSFSTGTLFYCISSLQCRRIFGPFLGWTLVYINESDHFSQFHPPPCTFINLYTPPSTLIYLYTPSCTFIHRHLPSDTFIYLHWPSGTFHPTLIYFHPPSYTYNYLYKPSENLFSIHPSSAILHLLSRVTCVPAQPLFR